MSLLLARKAAQAELSDDLHMLRILMLVTISGKWKGKKKIKGITKLAKMDFLLRYPNCLSVAIVFVILAKTGFDPFVLIQY